MLLGNANTVLWFEGSELDVILAESTEVKGLPIAGVDQ